MDGSHVLDREEERIGKLEDMLKANRQTEVRKDKMIENIEKSIGWSDMQLETKKEEDRKGQNQYFKK